MKVVACPGPPPRLLTAGFLFCCLPCSSGAPGGGAGPCLVHAPPTWEVQPGLPCRCRRIRSLCLLACLVTAAHASDHLPWQPPAGALHESSRPSRRSPMGPRGSVLVAGPRCHAAPLHGARATRMPACPGRLLLPGTGTAAATTLAGPASALCPHPAKCPLCSLTSPLVRCTSARVAAPSLPPAEALARLSGPAGTQWTM